MDFPNYFADAESSFEESDFVIYGVPYDKTSSFRKGANKAPEKIREASWNFETFNLRTGFDLRDIKLHDYGDLDVRDDDPKIMVKKVEEFVSKLITEKKFPIGIGGEHSITSGVINAYPKDIAVLSLDAHLDFRDEYENNRYNHACVTRRIADHIKLKNIAVLGVRSSEKEEFEEAKKMGLFHIDSFDIIENGIHNALIKIKNLFVNKKIYLTLDIDVLDPAYAPGTSTPEPFGLKPYDILNCIELFSKQIIGFDVVEVCPKYDNGETSILAAKLIRYLLELVSIKK